MENEPVTASNQSRVNSYIGGAILAVCGWVLVTVLSSNQHITQIETSLPYIQSSVSKLETQMSTLATHAELDSKMLEVKLEQVKFQNELLKAQREPMPPTTKR
jgi:uncharacterized protein YoxC